MQDALVHTTSLWSEVCIKVKTLFASGERGAQRNHVIVPLTAKQTAVLSQFDALSIAEQEEIAPLLQVAGGLPALRAQPRRAWRPTHYVSVLVNDSSFWCTEARSVLMSRNDCVNWTTFPTYQNRVRSWLSLLKIKDTIGGAGTSFSIDDSAQRRFERDAERTVECPRRRVAYIKALRLVYHKIGEYHEGHASLCAFLAMFLTAEDVAQVLWCLHDRTWEQWGYSRADRSTADAMVMYELGKVYVPTVIAHLDTMGIVKSNTDMYCAKWLCGLGVHMMPFSTLFSFLELVLFYGRDFLLRFSITYVHHLEHHILRRVTVAAVNALLRNEHIEDHKKAHPVIAAWPEATFFRVVIEKALQFNLNAAVDYKSVRDNEYQLCAHLMVQQQARVAQMAAEATDDDIVFSDEEDHQSPQR